MNRRIAMAIVYLALFLQANDAICSSAATEAFCSDAWYQFIDKNVPTGDGHGHGPDVGSDEWKSVVEFRLKIRGDTNLPDRDSDAWCRHIDRIVRERHASSEDGGRGGGAADATGPSYD